MIVDVIIVILLISAIWRGRDIGLVRQFFSTLGFFAGLIVGIFAHPIATKLGHSDNVRALFVVSLMLGLAFLGMILGEIAGIRVKRIVLRIRLANHADRVLGSVISFVSVLVAVWLLAGVAQSLPYQNTQSLVHNSKIASALVRRMPNTPQIISGISSRIAPNGFPRVFMALEPNPPDHINLPATSSLMPAITASRTSVVKITGQGCGGIVTGSGFVVGHDLIATNAHVVAGIHNDYIVDRNGTHATTAIWFDPSLDLALLRTTNLAGKPLPLNTNLVSNESGAVALGFPGGGGFTAEPAVIIAHLQAIGRDIYGKRTTIRSVYEIGSNIQQGNSGGPLIAQNGDVIGVIFAKSTTFNKIGYALTANQLEDALNKADSRTTAVSTGSCAE